MWREVAERRAWARNPKGEETMGEKEAAVDDEGGDEDELCEEDEDDEDCGGVEELSLPLPLLLLPLPLLEFP